MLIISSKKFALYCLLGNLIIITIIFSCDKYEREIKIVTEEVYGVRMTSAKVSGYIIDLGNGITNYGHCWGLKASPTISESKTDFGVCNKIGEFTSELTGLEANRYYYIRAYAANKIGIIYGEEKAFKTGNGIITLTTNFASKITRSSAVSGGYISDDGGSLVTDRGVCWDVNPAPDINDHKTSNGVGGGTYESTIINLQANTKYYLRAYATNIAGTSYGDQKSFKTADPEIVTDADGNLYSTVLIGNQKWMNENLKTTKYNDGTPIYFLDSQNKIQPGYYWYQGDSINSSPLGAYYIFSSTLTFQNKLCPVGWHVPSLGEVQILMGYLIANGFNYDGTKIDNKIAKSLSSGHGWKDTAIPGAVGNHDFLDIVNATGFSGSPDGYLFPSLITPGIGSWYETGTLSSWWTSTENKISKGWDYAWTYGLRYDNVDLQISYDNVTGAHNVRCIKNN